MVKSITSGAATCATLAVEEDPCCEILCSQVDLMLNNILWHPGHRYSLDIGFPDFPVIKG